MDNVRQKNTDSGCGALLWVIPALLPLLLILFFYVLRPWSWGLMDDLTILSSGTGIAGRFMKYFIDLVNWGVFRPTFVAHSAVFYTTFEHAPGLFYVLKWFEIMLMLGIWAWVVAGIRRSWAAGVFFSAIALSFHFLYDQFFFLSTQETLGLLFLGLSVKVFAGLLNASKRKSVLIPAMAGLFFLLCAFGAKETFVACGLAFGLALCVVGFGPGKDRRSLRAGLSITIVAIAYGIMLKIFVSKGYTGGYSFTAVQLLLANFSGWMRKDLINHLPWVVATGGVFVMTGGQARWREFSSDERFGLVLGALCYVFFLGILLPWNTTTYYAGPFGVFFAFFVAILLSRRLEKLHLKMNVLLIVCACALNLFVCTYALNREATYQYDTQNLWQWVKGNDDFQSAAKQALVACNAMEASVAIPGHADRWWALGLKSFKHTPTIEAARLNGSQYFVYSPRFGALDASGLEGWGTEFYSKYWQVYQKEAR
jgi:hypothetical protein